MKSIKIVGIVCLLLVSVVSGVIYLKQYVLKPSESPTTQAQEETVEVVEPTPSIEYSVFPREGVSVKGGVVNATGGEGEETLAESFMLGGYTYAIVHTDSNGMDYRATTPALGVAKFDSSATLLATVTLPVTGSLLTATPYEYGLLLVVRGAENLLLVTVDYALAVVTKPLAYTASSAKVLYTSDGVIVATGGERLRFFGLDGNLDLTFSHSIVSNGYDVCALYAYASTYIVFGKGLLDGAAWVWTKQGLVGSHAVARPDAITPYSQGFAVVSMGDQATLYRYDYQLAALGATPLQAAQSVAIGSYDGGIWVLLQQAGGCFGYTVCRHGDVQNLIELPVGEPTTPVWSGNAFVYWSEGEEGRLVAYTPLTNRYEVLLSVVGAKRTQWWRQGASVALVCDSDFDYGYFVAGLGGRDVYLIKIGL